MYGTRCNTTCIMHTVQCNVLQFGLINSKEHALKWQISEFTLFI